MEFMARLRVPRRRERPRTRPDLVLADKTPMQLSGRAAARSGARRQAIGLRPRDLEAAQHRRAVHQPPGAMARHRHPLREDRDHLPGRTPRRGHLPPVRSAIRTTPLSLPFNPWRLSWPAPCTVPVVTDGLYPGLTGAFPALATEIAELLRAEGEPLAEVVADLP